MSQALAESPRTTILAGPTGLQLRTLDEVWRFATCLTKSGLAPKGIETPEAITIAVQMGMEVGLPPMAAMQNIAVINGRPTLWGDAQLAVVRGTGDLEAFEEWYEQNGTRIARNPITYTDDTTAVCRVKRRGYEAQESGYSVADAKRAGLWDKQGPWKQTPFRMLRMRARSFGLRDAFGDALRGLRETQEAIDEPMPVRGRVVEAANVPAPAFLAPPTTETEPAAPVVEAAPAPTPAPEPKPATRRRSAAPPAQEPPPLALSAEPETPLDRINAAMVRSGVEWEDMEAVLIANGILDEPTSLARLDDGAVAIITEKLTAIVTMALERRAAK